MYAKITITAKFADEDVLLQVLNILESMLPYMIDNVDVKVDPEYHFADEDKVSDYDPLFDTAHDEVYK